MMPRISLAIWVHRTAVKLSLSKTPMKAVMYLLRLFSITKTGAKEMSCWLSRIFLLEIYKEL